MMLTGRDLREIAAKMANLDLEELEQSGVIITSGSGGSDWHRFNTDPLMFILKLPSNRLDILASMVSPHKSRVNEYEGEEW